MRPRQSVPDDRQHYRPRPSTGGKWKRAVKDQALGRSRGGLTTKIHMLVDALGRPLRFIVTAGQVGDITQAPALIDGQEGQAVPADKAYDSNALRATIASRGPKPSFPQTVPARSSSRTTRSSIGTVNNIERHFHSIASSTFDASQRVTRRTLHFTGVIYLAAILIWLR
ncbi:transposase [Sinorhizobium sp. 7-81]|uniref:transposase n=1 Tax=Sinorhizobium sp. 8-89 TaxID=3049089 RepID=UPI0024C3E3D5|nr:transposase [Sinorhizobium sp. 8-89]MDK1494672.1 transposase [Sinorhizobium sp. 8-89]